MTRSCGVQWTIAHHNVREIGRCSAFFYASAIMMGWIGMSTLAAHAIVMQIESFFFMVPIGLSQAATVRVGLASGTADSYRVKWAGWTAYGLGAAFMSLASLPLLIAPRFLLAIFVNADLSANAQVVSIGTLLLACAALFQIVDGIQVISVGMLRGLHDTSVPMLLAAVGYWGIGLPLGAFLAFKADFSGVGVWLGLSSGLTAVAILMTLRWITLTKPRSPRRPFKESAIA
jgi:multidrug resistance protein, MATE family